jgi:L-fuconolactonase
MCTDGGTAAVNIDGDRPSQPVVDAHIHLWTMDEPGFQLAPIMAASHARDFTICDLAEVLPPAGNSRAIAVTASRTLLHNQLLSQVMHESSLLAGIVGWFDLNDGPGLERYLDTDPVAPDLVGVRLVVAAEETGRYLDHPGAAVALGALARYGLVFELMPTGAADVLRAAELARSFPELRIVIDHLAKPIGGPSDEKWQAAVDEIGPLPNVCMKVSGWTTPVRREWAGSQLRPYLDYALERLGPERLMFGSNWPVTLVAGSYARMWDETLAAMEHLCESDRSAILSSTAHSVYALPSVLPSADSTD